MDKKEQTRIRVERYRKRQKAGVTQGDVTQDVTLEMFEGKPRYLFLSGDQVLDRANQPKPNKHLPTMIACNRANETEISRGRSKARRIAMIGMALDRTMTGLDGKPVKLSTVVRYGTSGMTFEEIAQAL